MLGLQPIQTLVAEVRVELPHREPVTLQSGRPKPRRGNGFDEVCEPCRDGGRPACVKHNPGVPLGLQIAKLPRNLAPGAAGHVTTAPPAACL
jgi:hypothetical protein